MMERPVGLDDDEDDDEPERPLEGKPQSLGPDAALNPS